MSSTIPANPYRYTPANGFTGTDPFHNTLPDGRGGSATTTVTHRVMPPVTSNSIAFCDGTGRVVGWTGFLTARFSETYIIHVPSDNGVRVWLDNTLLLDKWSPADITGWPSFAVALTAGQSIPN